MLLADLTDTEALAREVVARSRSGDLLVLTGPLGAGKTTLTQAIARQLGSTATVTSPTYTLVHEYPTAAGLLVHIDAYRLSNAADVDRLGLDDYLERARLTVVEWGVGLLELHPDALWLELGFAARAERADSEEPDAALDAPSERTAHWRRPAEHVHADGLHSPDRPTS